MPERACRYAAPRRPLCRLAGTALVVLAATGAVAPSRPDGARGYAESPRPVAAGDTGEAQPRPRPFAHARHERLSCRECHGAGAQHRTIFVRTPRDCASCHHDPARAMACTTCHAPDALPSVRVVNAPMRLPPSGAPRSRALAFRHALHVTPDAGLACRDCHRVDVTLGVERACASCHAPHHAPTADCGRCHIEAKPGVHQASVHLSCAGAGCHASATAPSPTASRNVCLVCHATQRLHEPDGVCAACHRIPGAPAPNAGGSGGGDGALGGRGGRR